MGKFCTKCGNPFQGEEKFCINCGAPREGAPVQQTAPQQKPAPVPPPMQPPVQAAAPRSTPVAPPAPTQPQKGKVGLIVGVVIGCLVLIVIVAAALYFLLGAMGKGGKTVMPPETKGVVTAEPTRTPSPNASPEAATPAPGASAPVIIDMEGIYYCADVPGYILELTLVGDKMAILKSEGDMVDIETSVDAPTANSFSLLCGGRSIDFLYSESARSITVVENGMANVYTPDGDVFWPEETDDPFTDPDAYILPTDTRFIEESELYGMDAEQVKLARNEIYARHGYSFTMEKFQTYFRGKNWYHENSSVNAGSFGTAQMNDYERTNLDTIKNYETKMGW